MNTYTIELQNGETLTNDFESDCAAEKAGLQLAEYYECNLDKVIKITPTLFRIDD